MSAIKDFFKNKKSLSSSVYRGESFLVSQKDNNKLVEIGLSGKARVLAVLSDREVSDLKKINVLERFPRSVATFKDSQCHKIPSSNLDKLCSILKIENPSEQKLKRDSRLSN